MSIGNENLHQRGDIPEIIKLPNNRIRVVRRFQKFTREDVDNANLGSLMGNFGALDTTDEQITNQGYTDCRLISVEVDNRFNSQANADNPVLVKTYETLTSTFVEVSSDTEEIGQNNLKQITKVYRAISGTTSSNTVGNTPLNPPEDPSDPSDGIVLASSKIEDNTAFAELTEVYVESGVLSVAESHKYEDKVQIYSVEGINITSTQARSAINNLPTSAKDYGSKISNFLGLETNIYEFFTGSGVVSTHISQSHNNKLTKTTIVSIDEEPSTPSGAVLVESKVEARDEFLLYTYTFAEGTGIISTETSKRYNNTLTLTTVTTINQQPTVPASAYTKESLVREESGYLLYTTTYVTGSGLIDTSTSTKYNGKLTLTTYTKINDVPQESGTLIRSSTTEGDYGTIYSYTYANGSGEISSSSSSRNGGKLNILTKSYLNTSANAPSGYTTIKTETTDVDSGNIITLTFASGNGVIATSTENRSDGSKVRSYTVLGSSEPSDSGYLIEKSYEAADGYDIYNYYYYDAPTNYTTNISTTYNKPSTLDWNTSDGFYISIVGSIESAVGTASVTFSTQPPAAIGITDISVGAVTNENVKYEDGTRLQRTNTFTNTHYNQAGGAITNTEYMGTYAVSGAVSSSGQELPTGTITVGWESVPYFYAGGTQIWKTTHTTISI